MSDVTGVVVNAEAAVHRDGSYLLVERADEEDHVAGSLSLVGGTVDPDGASEDVLASTVRRELHEEVGVTVDGIAYVTSSRFVSDRGTLVVNVVFVVEHADGEPEVREPDEVAIVGWYAPDAVQSDPDGPEFTREYVAAAERRRVELGW